MSYVFRKFFCFRSDFYRSQNGKRRWKEYIISFISLEFISFQLHQFKWGKSWKVRRNFMYCCILPFKGILKVIDFRITVFFVLNDSTKSCQIMSPRILFLEIYENPLTRRLWHYCTNKCQVSIVIDEMRWNQFWNKEYLKKLTFCLTEFS